ncbi:hypothetical protein AAY473_032527 [Plecturocebus cupreus]
MGFCSHLPLTSYCPKPVKVSSLHRGWGYQLALTVHQLNFIHGQNPSERQGLAMLLRVASKSYSQGILQPSASQSAGITGVSHHDRLPSAFSRKPRNPELYAMPETRLSRCPHSVKADRLWFLLEHWAICSCRLHLLKHWKILEKRGLYIPEPQHGTPTPRQCSVNAGGGKKKRKRGAREERLGGMRRGVRKKKERKKRGGEGRKQKDGKGRGGGREEMGQKMDGLIALAFSLEFGSPLCSKLANSSAGPADYAPYTGVTPEV